MVELSVGSVRSLTSGLAVAPDLTVSPDGEWLAFSATLEGDTDIYLASRDGGWAPITTSGDATAPTWGPGGCVTHPTERMPTHERLQGLSIVVARAGEHASAPTGQSLECHPQLLRG